MVYFQVEGRIVADGSPFMPFLAAAGVPAALVAPSYDSERNLLDNQTNLSQTAGELVRTLQTFE